MSTILQHVLVSWHGMDTLQFSIDSCILHISWHSNQSTQIKKDVSTDYSNLAHGILILR